MIEEVSGMDAAEQVLARTAPATRRAALALDELLARRASGEPLQYVLGAWGFCGLDLLVDRRVLIPRPETEVVATTAIREVERLGERIGRGDPWTAVLTHYAVADLGTGSGAIALALADSLPDAEVWATDVSHDALHVARANVAGSGTARRAGPDRARGMVRGAAGRAAGPTPARGLQPALHRGRRDPPAGGGGLGAGRRARLGAERARGDRGVDRRRARLARSRRDPGDRARAAPGGDGAGPRRSARGFAEVRVLHDLSGRERVLVARRRADR